MRYTLLRILKHGLPTALVLALVGYLMAEMAGMWVGSQPPPRAGAKSKVDTPAAVSSDLRSRLPFALAAWGLGVIAVYEVVLHFWRGGKAPPPPLEQNAVPTDSDVERLLNNLLQQAEAAEAARARREDSSPSVTSQTPIPAEKSPIRG